MSKKTTKTAPKKTDKPRWRARLKPELRADGNPVVGFRIPRGLLETFDKKRPNGRVEMRELLIKAMQRAVSE